MTIRLGTSNAVAAGNTQVAVNQYSQPLSFSPTLPDWDVGRDLVPGASHGVDFGQHRSLLLPGGLQAGPGARYLGLDGAQTAGCLTARIDSGREVGNGLGWDDLGHVSRFARS